MKNSGLVIQIKLKILYLKTKFMNSCLIFVTELNTTQIILAKYSHIIPVVLSIILGIFVLYKAKFNLFSKIFLSFVSVFSIWLIGDLITWTSVNYDLIYAVWSFLLNTEIAFYLLVLYFILVFITKKDLSVLLKSLIFLMFLPPLILTLLNNSTLGFYQPMCEALNNNFLDIYKLIVEAIILLITLYYIVRSFLEKQSTKIKRTNLIVLGSIFVFFSIFGITEYISATTGNYELNLYSLFLLPIFLLAIIYAVFELDIFHFNLLGTQYLVVGLVILIVGQVFFVNGTTDILLTVLTIIISVALSIILFKNLERESNQRVQIEDLSVKLIDANEKLKGLDKLKTEFVSLASHQLRSPLTAIKGYTSMLLEGDYGDINPDAKEKINRIQESSNNLTLVVEDLLNVTKIEQGGMSYEMVRFNFGELVENTTKDLSITAEKKGLKLIYKTPKDDKYFVVGDKEKIRQVVVNLIDNSMKYTLKGQIETSLIRNNGKILLSIKDTGVGIPKEIIGTLFEKFARGEGAKLNSSGSGLGLYLVKEIMEAHKGRVWVESEGKDKGSTFFVEIEEAK